MKRSQKCSLSFQTSIATLTLVCGFSLAMLLASQCFSMGKSFSSWKKLTSQPSLSFKVATTSKKHLLSGYPAAQIALYGNLSDSQNTPVLPINSQQFDGNQILVKWTDIDSLYIELYLVGYKEFMIARCISQTGGNTENKI